MTTKYCDIHGAVNVAPDQISCDRCSTVLKDKPEEMTRGLGATVLREAPTPQNTTANAREDEGKAMRQGAFLAAYAKTGRISKAAELSDCDRTRHYHWLEEPEYKRAFERAKLLAFHNLADEAWRRAMGEDGALPSDRLMIKLLESLGPVAGHPEYGLKVTNEHTGKDGAPIELDLNARDEFTSRIIGLASRATAPATDSQPD
jgi:hypothetical protein